MLPPSPLVEAGGASASVRGGAACGIAAAGSSAAERPFLINSSSGIIFASESAEAARMLRNQINTLLPEGFYD